MADEELEIVIDVEGDVESERRLNRVQGGVSRLGKSVKGLGLPLLGGGLLVGLLGGSLLGLALSSGAASNALFRIRDSLTQMLNTALEPILPKLYQFLEWFDALPQGQQQLILLGVAALLAIGPLKALWGVLAGIAGVVGVAKGALLVFVVIAVGAFAVLGLAIYDLINDTDKLGETWRTVWNFLPEPVQKALNAIARAFDATMDFLFINPINDFINDLNRIIGVLNQAINAANKLNPFDHIPQVPTIGPYVHFRRAQDYFPDPTTGEQPLVRQPFSVGTAPWVLSAPNPDLATAQGQRGGNQPFMMGDTNIQIVIDGKVLDQRTINLLQDPNVVARLNGAGP